MLRKCRLARRQISSRNTPSRRNADANAYYKQYITLPAEMGYWKRKLRHALHLREPATKPHNAAAAAAATGHGATWPKDAHIGLSDAVGMSAKSFGSTKPAAGDGITLTADRSTALLASPVAFTASATWPSLQLGKQPVWQPDASCFGNGGNGGSDIVLPAAGAAHGISKAPAAEAAAAERQGWLPPPVSPVLRSLKSEAASEAGICDSSWCNVGSRGTNASSSSSSDAVTSHSRANFDSCSEVESCASELPPLPASKSLLAGAVQEPDARKSADRPPASRTQGLPSDGGSSGKGRRCTAAALVATLLAIAALLALTAIVTCSGSCAAPQAWSAQATGCWQQQAIAAHDSSSLWAAVGIDSQPTSSFPVAGQSLPATCKLELQLAPQPTSGLQRDAGASAGAAWLPLPRLCPRVCAATSAAGRTLQAMARLLWRSARPAVQSTAVFAVRVAMAVGREAPMAMRRIYIAGPSLLGYMLDSTRMVQTEFWPLVSCILSSET